MTGPPDMAWQADALCAGTPIEWWYPGRGDIVAAGGDRVHPEAARLCAACPAHDPCRQHAIRHEMLGTWAGLSAQQRRRLRSAAGITLHTPGVHPGGDPTPVDLWRQGVPVTTIAERLGTYPRAVYRRLRAAGIHFNASETA